MSTGALVDHIFANARGGLWDGARTRAGGALEPAGRVLESEDWNLLARSADGDRGAFDELVRRHQQRLYSLCRRLLGNPGEAEDAVQEVLMKLYLKADSFQPRGKLYTLLYRMASNYCLNQLRRRRIVRFLPLVRSRDASAAEDEPMDPMDERPGPAETLDAKARWGRLKSHIDGLPYPQRVVLLLVRFEGLSYKETAEVLEITVGAVESRLFRAMQALSKSEEATP